MSAKSSKPFEFPEPFDTQYHDPQEPPYNGLLEAERSPESLTQELPEDPQEESSEEMQEQPEEQPDRARQRKRLIVCCDGTGQSTNKGIGAVPTNVTRLARAIDTSDYIPATDTEPAVEIPQIVLYQNGVGTEEASKFGSGLSSAFGYGVDRHILEAYSFFSLNYEEGDELYLFGFSRGAFTARAIASLVCNVGLVTKDCLDRLPIIYERYQKRVDSEDGRHELETWIKERVKDDQGELENKDPKDPIPSNEKFTINKGVIIYAMGLFDTVGSLGIPDGTVSTILKPLSWFGIDNSGYQYHDTSFPIATNLETFRAHIVSVYQVLALDECRTSFTPTLLYDYGAKSVVGHGTMFNQIWMPGVHTDVGGGYERAFGDLSDISFAWIYDNLKGQLKFRSGVAKELLLPSLQPGRNPTTPQPKNVGYACSPEHDEYHTAKFKFGGQKYRGPGQQYLKKSVEMKTAFRTCEFIHPSVRVRMLRTGWKPPALDGFRLVRAKRYSQYYYSWVKECEVDGKKVTIKLDEWNISTKKQSEKDIERPWVDMEAFLIDEEAKQIIEDRNCHKKLSSVIGEKSGWVKWLTAF